MQQRFKMIVGAALLASAFGTVGAQEIAPEVIAQIQAVQAAKRAFTPAQKKMDSALVLGIYKATNDPRVAAFTNAISPLSEANVVAPSVQPTGVDASPASAVTVTIVAPVSDDLNAAIAGVGGSVVYQSTRFGRTTVALPLTAIQQIAARDDVTRIKLPALPTTHAGAVTSQGYVTHAANTTVSNLHVDGTGVMVGVLSDSASSARVAALIASGDLPPTATSLPGQSGDGLGGEDEGTAMMEIVHDMAPGADIRFATAFISEESFADNIVALADAGCKVIVDDVSYFDEPAFQDGIVAKAVNTVTARGVIYFSSAANSGNVTKGTSGTWEGDFKDGGAVSGVVGTSEGGVGRVHNFSATGAQNYDPLTVATSYIFLHWSDPVGASGNDYDLFVLNAAGTSVLAVSGDTQDGTGDPIEGVYRSAGFPVGARVVVVKYSGDARALHIDTERGALQIATSGATFGHNAGLNTVSTAATYWNSAKTGTRAFTGAAQTIEAFSSDGPRKIFYDANGVAITPGNLLFATNGGVTLQKPDVTAADGVSTRTPGFLPFFGTSAAAPHAAAIAALVRSARPDYTVAQTKAAMTATALDTMATGVDRDSGYGIVMADRAVSYAKSH